MTQSILHDAPSPSVLSTLSSTPPLEVVRLDSPNPTQDRGSGADTEEDSTVLPNVSNNERADNSQCNACVALRGASSGSCFGNLHVYPKHNLLENPISKEAAFNILIQGFQAVQFSPCNISVV
jgi:hypothetical protein